MDDIQQSAAQLFVRCLEAQGVGRIFAVPGEENLDLLEAIRTSSIELIVTRHEQGAAFMAATYGRLTGRAGVALSTLGPGATNLVTGVAYAQLGGMPLVVITGQKPIKKSKQGQFQIIDAVHMMEPITKMTETIVGADNIPSLVSEAFREAEYERPGAVHLELPEDIARELTTARPLERTTIRRPGPDPKAITRAVQMIEQASHPLIVVAAGANRKLIRKHLAGFIDKTHIPFVTTQMGKGVIDETSDHYMGTCALSRGDYSHCAVESSDVVMVIGHDVTEKPPAIMGHGTREVIHINFYPAQVDDVYFANHEVIGDISHSLWAMTEAITPSPRWDFSYIDKLRRAMNKHIHTYATADAFPIKPQRFVADLRSVMPDNGILSLDNGMYKIWVARNYPAIEQNSVLLDNALATMGAGLPGAMAAKLVHPDRAVVAVVGDGGFMMNSQELETSMRLGLDLVVVIVRDNGYGMIKWKQQDMGLQEFGLDFNNPDFVEYARSYGASGYRITRADEFVPVLQKAIASPGVHVVELPIDYSENHHLLGEELKKDICNQ